MQKITKSNDLTILNIPTKGDYVLGVDDSQTDLSKKTVQIPIQDLSDLISDITWSSEQNYSKDGLVQDEGVLWSSKGDNNLDNKPSTNQTLWYKVSAPQNNITAIDTDVLDLGWFDYNILVDATTTDSTINIGIPQFVGQRVIIQVDGNFFVNVLGQELTNESCNKDNCLEVVATVNPAGTIKWEVPNSELEDRFVVAGVIRYYSSLGRWELIENEEGNHPPINISSIQSDTNQITINYTKTGQGVTSFVATPDEAMARYGITLGSSVSSNKAEIEMYMPFESFIEYNGSAWTDTSGILTLTWNVDRLEITGMRLEAPAGGELSAFGPTFPIATPRAQGYICQLGSVSNTKVEVFFYNFSGVKQTVEDPQMQFYIKWNAPFKMNPNNFPDFLGNIWFMGLIKK